MTVIQRILWVFALLMLVVSQASALAHACAMTAAPPQPQELSAPSCHDADETIDTSSDHGAEHSAGSVCDCMGGGCSPAVAIVFTANAEQSLLPHHVEFHYSSLYSYPSRESRFRPPSMISVG